MTYAIGPAKAIMVGRGLFRSINRSAFGGIVSHHRAFRSTTASSMPVATDIRVSDGEPDSSTIIEQATTLVEKRGWTLCADGKGLERDFRFKTFGKTWVSVIERHPVVLVVIKFSLADLLKSLHLFLEIHGRYRRRYQEEESSSRVVECL
jgi:hypothetical protein